MLNDTIKFKVHVQKGFVADELEKELGNDDNDTRGMDI